MSVERAFDLVEQPWVLTRAGAQARERSLRDVFARAHEIDGVAGEIPTQEVAVLRVLLVILRRSLPPAVGPAAVDQWRQLWDAEQLPTDQIDEYLGRFHDRFDLFNGTEPFFQVADLQAGKTSGPVKLIGDAPDGHPYFTTRNGPALQSLSAAEAARWIVHCQAFDPSGIKSGAVGDPRVKGGKGYPIGTGWTGRCGVVLLEGRSLKETLLLNLPAYVDADLPTWERVPLGPSIEQGHQHPVGPCDLMTWPIRRIRLLGGADGVDDVLISNGDPVQWFNQHGVEPMSAWRFSEPQTKKLGHTAYMPRKHDPDREIWRGLTGLLVRRVSGGSVRNEPERSIRPGTLDQLDALLDAGAVPAELPVRLRAIGMEYGSNDSVVATITDDQLQLRSSVLVAPHLVNLVTRSVATADDAVQALVELAGNLAQACGELPEAARAAARLAGYAALDEGYRQWVVRLHAGSDIEQCEEAWQRHVRHVLHRLGEQWCLQQGDDAYRGREVTSRDGKVRRIDAGQALVWFESKLRTSTPYAASSSNDDSEEVVA